MFSIDYLWGIGSTFALTAIFTHIIIKLAHYKGIVTRPEDERSDKRQVALFGGIAIFIAFITSHLVFTDYQSSGQLAFLIGAAVVFITGLIYDIWALPPVWRLVGQGAAAVTVLSLGISFNTGAGVVVDWGLTLFWIVGITNAVNLLDNMDGLAVGIAGISSIMLFIYAVITANPLAAFSALALTGTSLGFLIFNFNPARIILGNSGSFLLGYSLSVLSVMALWTRLSDVTLTWNLAVPVMFLMLPVIDTAFVLALRKIKGRPIFKEGQDHLSHRLAAAGLTERKAVIFLYVLSIFFGLLGLSINWLNTHITVVVYIFSFLGVVYLAVFLAQVPVYLNGLDSSPPASTGGDSGRGSGRPGLLYEAESRDSNSENILRNEDKIVLRRIAEGAADIAVLIAAFVAAHLLHFGGVLPQNSLTLMAYSLPIIIMMFFVSFFIFGLYHRILRYSSVHDLLSIYGSIIVGGIASYTILTLFRFYPDSNFLSLFLIFILILLIAIPANHLFLKVLYRYFSGKNCFKEGKKAAIYGAGDMGETVLRELMNNPGLKYDIVGFIDDDSTKHGYRIHGIPILQSLKVLKEFAKNEVEEVIIAMPSAPKSRLRDIYTDCKELGLTCKEANRVRIE